MEQITEEGAIIVAVERDSCKSRQLVELLARFAEGQGFESILEVLAKEETSLQGVHDLVMIVSGCAALYHKSFVDSYFERLKDAVESKLESAGEAHLRKAQFKTIEDTVQMVWM